MSEPAKNGEASNLSETTGLSPGEKLIHEATGYCVTALIGEPFEYINLWGPLYETKSVGPDYELYTVKRRWTARDEAGEKHTGIVERTWRLRSRGVQLVLTEAAPETL